MTAKRAPAKGSRVPRTRSPVVAAAVEAATGDWGTLGRKPVPYHPDYDDRAITLSIAGFSLEKMADVFGVSLNVFRRWMSENETFMRAVRFGTDQADALVERSLFKLATGYVRPEIDVRVVSMGDGLGSEIVDHPVQRWYPPSATSQIFYLANRQRARYKRGDPIAADANPADIAKAARAAIAALDDEESEPE